MSEYSLSDFIDFFVPSTEGDIGNLTENETRSIALKRMGFMTALAIGIHNFPRGPRNLHLRLKDPHLGLAIAVAIAIHNIQEGIATSVPYILLQQAAERAFIVSFFQGITEPLGAIIGI